MSGPRPIASGDGGTPHGEPDSVEASARLWAQELLAQGEEADQWIEPTLVGIPALSGFHPPELLSPIVCATPYDDPGEIRRWLCSEPELARGMYVSVYGEPALPEPRIGTTVNCEPANPFDVEDGNRPFGGYGPQAGSCLSDGNLVGRPLLLSGELARRSDRAASMAGTGR